MDQLEKFLTADEVIDAIEKRFGVRFGPRTITNYAAGGQLSAVKIGKSIRYTASSVARYLNAPPPAKLTPRKPGKPRQAAAQPQPSTAPEPPPAAPAKRQQRVRAGAPA